MNSLPATQAALDALSELLECQRIALQHGQADDLPAIAKAVHARLGLLMSARPQGLDPHVAARLVELRQRAQSNLILLARRMREAEDGLAALGAGSARLQDLNARSTYAAAGRMAAPGVRGRTLAAA